MSAESELYTALSADAALTALIGDRLYPDALPEGEDYPGVVYSRQGSDPIDTLGGANLGEFASLVISAWGTDRTSAKAVMDAIVPVLVAAGNPPLTRSSGFDPEAGLFGDTVECEWFSTT